MNEEGKLEALPIVSLGGAWVSTIPFTLSLISIQAVKQRSRLPVQKEEDLGARNLSENKSCYEKLF
eukprot:1753086-Ditylum_brightwellii.AAC.1